MSITAKCYISKTASAVLCGDEGMGESFWVELLTKNTAEVRNNCLCGLGIGDIIKFKSYKDDGIHHPREFVSVVRKRTVVYGMTYSFDGIDEMGDKFPAHILKFIKRVYDSHNIKMEGVVRPCMSVACDYDMTREDLLRVLNDGPMTFSFA